METISPQCVYAIKHSTALARDVAMGGQATYQEKRRWVGAKKLLDECRKTDMQLAIVFAPAEATRWLFACGILADVSLTSSGTEYSVTSLRLLPQQKYRKTDIRVRSTGKRIPAAYIRSNLICRSPSWLAVCMREPSFPSAKQATGNFDQESIVDQRRRELAFVVQRQGQTNFRTLLLASYGGQCAVTGCSVVATLEAAHIVPYHGPDANAPSNGLLLRADVHILFDLGQISIQPEDVRIVVHDTLKNTEYWRFNGQRLREPVRLDDRPCIERLRFRDRMNRECES